MKARLFTVFGFLVVIALLAPLLPITPSLTVASVTTSLNPYPAHSARYAQPALPRLSITQASGLSQATNTFTGTATVASTVAFEATGSMSAARHLHSATLLANGKVLIAGGYSDGTSITLSSAELYDPATSTFSNTGSMTTARASHTATLLQDGRVLIAGGRNQDSGPQSSAELYDPTTGTFAATGSMTIARYHHTATPLPDASVLIAGGPNDDPSAELYYPTSGTFTATGDMISPRHWATATSLPDGKVLVTGGEGEFDYPREAELYNPTTGTFTATGSMRKERKEHTATLLPSGEVLVVGGEDMGGCHSSAEIYDPATGIFTFTGSMADKREDHTATLLKTGMVLIAGTGRSGLNRPDSWTLYDPSAGAFVMAGSMGAERAMHTATLLQDGTVLVAGGQGPLNSAEIATWLPANVFTGTLTLLSGWATTNTITVTFFGSTADAPLNAGSLSNDGNTWGDWITATVGTASISVTTTWNLDSDGSNKPVYLRLRDVNGQVARVVTGTVNVDTTKPSSSMSALPATSPSAISLSWSGSDGLSGVASYDLQVRIGGVGEWISVLTDTTATSTTYNGTSGSTYYFRARATDAAGNTEPWPDTYDTFTLVDTEIPTGSLIINSGALATPSQDVILTLSANDILGSVDSMSFSNDRSSWSNWQPYAGSTSWSLSTGDGLKTVYGRFRDTVGNISSTVSDTVELDTTAGTDYGLTINDGAPFTNKVTVTLTIGAQPGTVQMQVSNDGGFVGVEWEPYASRKAWTITQYGSYVIPRVVYVRYREISGNVSSTYQDDIILDVTAPTGSVEAIPMSTSLRRGRADNTETRQIPLQATDNYSHTVYLPLALGHYCILPTGPPNVTLYLQAQDDVSGVADMMISHLPSFGRATWEAYATTKAWYAPSGTTMVYVKFRDNAGNVSHVVTDAITW